jgi:GH24 family phage-related lysozyme (muramidase)
MQWRSISCQYLRSLMMRFEAGPKEGPRCPDGGALLAYQCAAGKWTIAFGVRWHPDGRPVVEGDTITPEQVWEYTDAAVARVEADIRSVVTVEMNPHQYAGIVFWVYNLGIGALVNTMEGESQLLPKINAGRWLDAAAAMGVFVYATTEKGGKTWKRAMFGLFIRRSAEGLTLMGFDWPYACEPERLSLPTRTDWQPARDRYYDAVLEGKTPFLNVLRDAKDYPLTLVLTQPAPPPTATGSTVVVGGTAGATPRPAPAATPPQVSPAPPD